MRSSRRWRGMAEVLKRGAVGIQVTFSAWAGFDPFHSSGRDAGRAGALVLNIKDIFQFKPVEKLASASQRGPHDGILQPGWSKLRDC